MARAALSDRYLIVPCDPSGAGGLAVIWDRREEQVIDVISSAASARYAEEDALWDEFHAPARAQPQWRLAA